MLFVEKVLEWLKSIPKEQWLSELSNIEFHLLVLRKICERGGETPIDHFCTYVTGKKCCSLTPIEVDTLLKLVSAIKLDLLRRGLEVWVSNLED